MGFVIGALGQDNHGKETLVEAIAKTTPDLGKSFVSVKARYVSHKIATGDVKDCPLDAAIVVVAATEGLGAEGAAHLRALAEFGIPTVVAITKTDVASHKTVKAVESEVRGVVHKSFNHDIPVLRISARMAVEGDARAVSDIKSLVELVSAMVETGQAIGGESGTSRAGSTQFYVTGRELDRLLRDNVVDALREHADAGRGVVVWRDGGVVELSPGEIRSAIRHHD